MASLSLGHLAADIAQNAPPALLVFWKPKLGLSYTMAAGVVLALTVSTSIVQPFFGRWSDRRGALWLMPAGVAVGGIGIALAAVVSSYSLLLALVFIGGLGVGAYHPESAKFAGFASGARRATGMAVYSIGGNVGSALGPLIASVAVLAWGLEGGLVLMAPGLLMAAVLVIELRYIARFAPPRHEHERRRVRWDGQRKAVVTLLAVIVLRSVAYYGLFTFVPLWEVAQGRSAAYATGLLAGILAGGAVGTIIAGPLADRFGRQPVLLWSLALTVPLLLAYVLVGGIPGMVAVVIAGATIVGTFGVTLVMSQEYMPGQEAMASGLSVGFAIGIGGVAALVLGAVADAVDLRAALLLTAAGPAFAAVLAVGLPRTIRAPIAERVPSRASV
jgi:MFS transporter, FSR family, fosmidomycin resistance protein